MATAPVPAEPSRIIYVVERASERKSELSEREAQICRIAGYCIAAVGLAILLAGTIATMGSLAGVSVFAYALSESFFIWGIMAVLGGFQLVQARSRPEVSTRLAVGPLSLHA